MSHGLLISKFCGYSLLPPPNYDTVTTTSAVLSAALPAHHRAEKHRDDRVLLFFLDVWSSLHINSQLQLNYFAASGFLVLAPDCFENDVVYLHTAMDILEFDPATSIDGRRVFVPSLRSRASFLAPLVALSPHVPTAIASTTTPDENHFHNVEAPLFLSYIGTSLPAPSSARDGSYIGPRRLSRKFAVTRRNNVTVIGVSSPLMTPSARAFGEPPIHQRAVFALQLFSGGQHSFVVKGDLANKHERMTDEGGGAEHRRLV
ncbi:hypothetical protein K488DRAFT_85665 [Vararia minispora EC-137]|uniref:Uncharacterized protein n=1 Tax=Vararia minispora EC-137 TaxID=1314806 RepID=A0ACB8QLC0_9AGAM|nr:hypothetical protein K488DRAFT_85665 [Vararia minispora EC-137]